MTAAPRPDRFLRHWLALLAVGLLGAAGWRAARARFASAGPPRALPAGPARWYLILQMPPVKTNHESGLETMRGRYDEWLRALRAAGFVPVTLTQARDALLAGGGLPERSVVAVFEPGWRRTLDVAAPIFLREGWPAVLLTDSRAMRAGSREHVTFHAARRMSASGWWDVGYSRRDGGYDVVSRSERFVLAGGSERAWDDENGATPLNIGAPRGRLRGLAVDPNWTARELVDRVRASLPVERAACLSKAVIQRKEWGVTGGPPGAEGCPSFSLAAPPGKRGARLFWLGARGAAGFRVSFSAERLVGEAQLHLLADEQAGRELLVAFSPSATVVARRSGSAVLKLAVIRGRKEARAQLAFAQDRLSLIQDGRLKWISPAFPASEAGVLELSVIEKVRGVARADGVRLTFEPVTPRTLAASR